MPHPIIQRPDEEQKSASEAPASDAATPPVDANLAGFALLADPGTIAGEVDAPAVDAQEEVERLRAALYLRSQEIEALQAKWSGASEEAPAPLESNEPDEARGALLDAASARRLAADARKRERESRAALEAAQNALRTEPVAPEADETDGAEPSGWQRRALVARSAPAPDEGPSVPESATPTSEAKAPPPRDAPTRAALDPEDTIRALGRELRVVRAENRERESTLALARETTRRQREEIERLRTALAERERHPVAEPREVVPLAPPAPGPAQTTDAATVRALDEGDSVALAARLMALETELAERDADRARLESVLAEARGQEAQRRDHIDALEDRLEAQDRALDAARREYELERQRHTRSRRLIARLRATLSAAAPDESLFEDDDAIVHEAVGSAVPGQQVETTPATTAAADEAAVSAVAVEPLSAATRPTAEDEVRDDTREHRRADAKLFGEWLDDQVRRHFGPMGIDRLSDLLIGPLARRSAATDERSTILLLGRNVWHRAATLAEGLVAGSPAPVEIHVADPIGRPDDLDLDLDSPVRKLLIQTPVPEDPAALAALLEALRPAVVVSHDHLSREASPDAWLDVLEDAAGRRSALLFVESTGIGAVDAPDEVRTVGDRIWSLLPERYALRPGEERPYPSWSAAFDAAPAGIANELFEALRTRFRPELSARFGFLVAPFLHAGLAANFDLDAERDRRFLEQVADLDERRIEAGEAPALHGIVLVDPLAEA